MSNALARASASKRGSLLGMVLSAHIAIFWLLLNAKSVAPQIMEMPMVVDLLEATLPQSESKPLSAAKPVPLRTQAARPSPIPLIEATQSNAAAANAPLADAALAVNDSKPTANPLAETLSQPRFDADYLRNPAPRYPPLSRRMGEEGKVVLRVLVSPQGNAESVDIKTSSGSQRLDDSAVNTVKNWKFIAARRGETAIQNWVLVPIIFKLEQ